MSANEVAGNGAATVVTFVDREFYHRIYLSTVLEELERVVKADPST